MGTVPMGIGALRRIHSRVSWMFLPVDRSIRVSPPQRADQTIFSTSSSMLEVTAELPMLVLIFTRKLRPMIMGSSSGWLMLAGMIALPRATSSRTNSGVMVVRQAGAEGLAAVLAQHLGVARIGAQLVQPHVLPDGDVLHLRRDDALPRIVHLGDVAPRLGAARGAEVLEAEVRQVRVGLAAVPEGGTGTGQGLRIAAGLDPGGADVRQPGHEVDA